MINLFATSGNHHQPPAGPGHVYAGSGTNGAPVRSGLLRVCHLGKFYPPAPGGIETHLQTLAQAQARLGLAVEVLCMNHRPGPTVREMDGPVKVTRFRPAVSVAKLELCPELVTALRRVDADVLHVQVPNPTMLLALFLARPRQPLVVTYQADLSRQKVLGPLFRPVEHTVYRRVRKILSTSPPYAAGSQFLRRHRRRTDVVPMGLDLQPYLDPSPEDRRRGEELRQTWANPIWLACGRLIYYKGLVNAVRALGQVKGTLVIVGDGPERGPLEAEARRLGVAERVVFVGELPYWKVIPYYLAATAFWFPSNARAEAFGLVQVEAMACGCPVINTHIPGSGVSWVSRHEETGLTVPLDDPEALAAAADRLLSEPGLRERLGRAGRARAVRNFHCDLMARRTLDVYRSLCPRK
jgi:rhamnosyl/mannosyltransferase